MNKQIDFANVVSKNSVFDTMKKMKQNKVTGLTWGGYRLFYIVCSGKAHQRLEQIELSPARIVEGPCRRDEGW